MNERRLPRTGSGFLQGSRRFVTTHWTAFFRQGRSERLRDEALRTDSSTVAAVYRHYGTAVHGYIHSKRASFRIPRHLSTEDLTQEFFEVQLQRDALRSVQASKGSFRAWLRACLKNFLRDVAERERALKRCSEGKLEPLYGTDGREFPLESAQPMPDGLLDQSLVKRHADALEPDWAALFEAREDPTAVHDEAPTGGLEQTRLRQRRHRAQERLIERMRAIFGIRRRAP